MYLACFRQSRLERNWTGASVYGVSSDGYRFTGIFVTITHDGTVKMSKTFDILHGDLPKILGWLKVMLEITAAVSPNVILVPERNAVVKNDGEDFDDPPVDTDDSDNDYTTPPEDED